MPSTLKLWPSGGNLPIKFINIVGDEETLTVATEEGSERSKCNKKEIEKVVSVTGFTDELRIIIALHFLY